MRSIAGTLLPVLVGAVLAAGCTGRSDPDPANAARFEPIDCPSDVDIVVVPQHRCGQVVSRRSSGLQTRVFVLIVEPPTPSDAPPILETGTDLGITPGYGGLAPIAQRTGRRTVIVDLPGTGHSQPLLDCPDVEGTAQVGEPGSADLATAIAACRHQVEKTGVNPGDLTPEKMAEDLFAVMTAMDAPRWVLMGHGTTGAAALEVARQHPDQVEALVLDSFVQADTDPAQRLDDIAADVARQCNRDSACHSRYGDVTELWQRAQRTLARTTLVVRGKVDSVTIDPGELRRAVRWLVAPVNLGPTKLPELLTEVVSRTPGPLLRLYAATAESAPPLCVGYLPKCDRGDQIALGAVLSSLCPTSAELADWREPCHAWGIGTDSASAEPVQGVPTLVLYGRYDPFAAPSDVRRQVAAQLPNAFVVEDPVAGHNVLGQDCMRSIRNAWLAGDHAQPPPRPECLSDELAFD